MSEAIVLDAMKQTITYNAGLIELIEKRVKRHPDHQEDIDASCECITNNDNIVDQYYVETRILHIRDNILKNEDGAEDDAEELISLLALANEIVISLLRDATLIRESHFEEFARSLADDLHGTSSTSEWPFQFIDWKAATQHLKMDYIEIDFDGITYLTRS